GIFPSRSKTGIDIISTNLLLDDDTAPVVWRGPVIAGMVKQFWTDVIWDGVEYLFVDCPPGTGDVPLTVFQSIPLDGIIIVTSPQELVAMIVEKAANMAKLMNIPVLGIVENMSYLKCPDCGREIKVFGDAHTEEIAKKFGFDLLARIPIDSNIARLADGGEIEKYESDAFDAAADKIIEKISRSKN
ncbi:MAG: P-loop NTPase, partial [Clostridia bacterium]|nr:P-loop NTPase [Clostridia bacterium]